MTGARIVFALALATWGLVQLVYVFDGEGPYRDLVVAEAPAAVVLPLRSGGTWHLSREGLVVIHRATLAYVLAEVSAPPVGPDGSPLFSDDENAHLADVRTVFGEVRIAWAAAGLLLLALIVRARRRRELARPLRDGAVLAAAGVVVVGIAAAVAFEPLFLAFHEVFFPQGNFLFDPASSNLLAVYPERYWYGVTIRVGATFVICAAVVSGLATLALRARRAP